MFTQATKQRARLRMAITGPSGSGKTYTSLALATNLGDRVAVIDTEHGSASKYADRFAFDVVELETFGFEAYVEAINAAAREGYDVLVIDSLSHAWSGRDGALERVDKAAKRTRDNSYVAWREVTPQHNALLDAIIRAPMHVIATMRSKTEYVMADVNGKQVPRKVGLAPIQRDGVEYEFDVVGDMTLSNDLVVSKSRCATISGQIFSQPGEDLAQELAAWLADGIDPSVRPADLAPEKAQALYDALEAAGADRGKLLAHYGAATIAHLTESQFRDAMRRLQARITNQTAGGTVQ
jgi:KaiC/GvpD/RAD55 family RecA-like ATPase